MKPTAGEKSVEKSATCSSCGKTFGRLDSLHRHEKSHSTTEDRGPIHRVTNDTFRACQACAKARSRCSGDMPCGRCGVRNIECTYPNKRHKALPHDGVRVGDAGLNHQQSHALVFAPENQVQDVPGLQANIGKPPASTLVDAPVHATHQDSYATSSFQLSYTSKDPSMDHAQGSSVTNGPNSITPQVIQQDHFSNSQLTTYHSAFDPVTAAFDYTSFDEPLNWIPPSIYPSPYDSQLEQEFSFIFQPLPDTSAHGAEYHFPVPLDSTSQVYQATATTSHDVPDTYELPASLISSEQSPDSSTSDGIKRPRSNIAAFLNPDSKRRKRKASSVENSFLQSRRQRIGYVFPNPSDSSNTITSKDVTEYCSHTIYDFIFDAFRRLCGPGNSSKPFESMAFPTFQSFNACIGLYFEHFSTSFPLVHQASFGSHPHWILMLATAAIGSTFTKTTHALDIREAFQEFLRRALEEYADGVPDTNLDLPLAQARILNLVGLVQSDREQLRALAPRYHADLSRWCLESGVIQLPENTKLADFELNGNVLDDQPRLWQQWISAESWRRVAYLVWMLDCCLGYMANARPLCNMDDARTPLPSSEGVWQASDVDAWAKAMRKSPSTLSLCTALETLYSKKAIDLDHSDLCQVLLIHALYQRTWAIGTQIKQPLSEWVPTGKARGFLNTPSKDNFWLPLYPLYANWRNSACDCLDVLHWHASSIVAKASGIEHGIILHLHLARIVLLTPFQEIQDLSLSLIEKVGESPKASFYVHDGSYQPRNSAKLPQIRKIIWRWLCEDQHKARLAMVHAGSVFWHVRRYSTMSLFEPVAVYLASLVLWTYGSYNSAALERDITTAGEKPRGGPGGPDAAVVVQPTRMERKRRSGKTPNRDTTYTEARSEGISPRHSFPETAPNTEFTSNGNAHVAVVPFPGDGIPQASAAVEYDSDGIDGTSSSEGQPEFIHLDRPCDDEMVQHFVRNGHNMSGHMSNVGDICKTPHKVLLEGAKLLRTRLACWGVSREYHDIMSRMAELRRAG